MPQALYKAINPVDYLSYAETLISDDQTCCQRTAADRAYYAAFLFWRNELATKYPELRSVTGAKIHKIVCEKLKIEIGSLANDLRILRDARNEATYNTDLICLSDTGRACHINYMISVAKKLIGCSTNKL